MFSYFSDSKTSSDKHKENTSSKNYHRNAQNKTSVRKNDNAKDLDLGKLIILIICIYFYLLFKKNPSRCFIKPFS